MTWTKKRITPILAALVILSALITASAGQPDPCIEIEKRINGEDYVTAAPGDALEITLWINNCGNVNLTNLSVHDSFPPKKLNAGLTWTGNLNSDPPVNGEGESLDPEGWINFTLGWWGNLPFPLTQGHLVPFEPLQPGENFTITFEATVDELAEGAYEDCATVSANYAIPGQMSVPVNNTDCATVFVPSEASALTPTGLIALVSLLSAIAAVAIVRKRQ
jgi:uncharacterized repeat protein (TIGR01451 family)